MVSGEADFVGFQINLYSVINRQGLEVPLFDLLIGIALSEKPNLVGNRACSNSNEHCSLEDNTESRPQSHKYVIQVCKTNI